MYCSATLAAAADPPAATAPEEDARVKAERARQLLDSLKPAARAMMPPEVLAKLEADANAGLTGLSPVASSTSGVSAPPAASAPPAERESARPRRGLGRRRRGAPRQAPPPTGPITLEELPVSSLESLDAPETPAPSDDVSYDEALLDALGRGGGPFGPRQTAWRLVLLPDPTYRASLPWMRPRLADTVGIDAYTASQYLQRPTPSFLAAAEEPEPLEAQAAHLASAGLRVVVLPRRDWARDRLPVLVADVLDLDADPVLFLCADGSRVEVQRRDLGWAATAEISPIRENSTVEVKRTRWGMPVMPDRVGLSDRFTPYYALDLCRHGDPRPLRIRSNDFDFQRLGADRGIAAAVNIRTLALRLGGADLPVDQGFRKVPSLPGPKDPTAVASRVPRREVDFTEYVLLLDARHHVG